MNFAELRFWGYLLAGLALVLLLRPWFVRRSPATAVRFDKLALLALGWFLLLGVGTVTFVIFLFVAFLTYFGLGWIQRHEAGRQRPYLYLLVTLQVLPLLYYKYANFVTGSVLHVHFDTLRDLIIPVGISFYTFQKIAFVIDTIVFRCERPPLLDYLNFAGFFPQIVAGPIERRADLLPQMEAFRFRWSASQVNEGATWMVLGFFFKLCLADNLANVFNGASTTNAYHIWIANLVFGLRIYFDFAGYSLVAVGIARCLGVRLTLNFLSPYCATGIGDFWRRWHVTLSQWLRDYLYVPLGGGRVSRWPVNIAIVFIVSGVWHGAGWNFILWGALHGALLIISRLASGTSLSRLPAPLTWLLTMAGVFFAWLCFYEIDTTILLQKIHCLLTPSAYRLSALLEALATWTPGDRVVLGCTLALAFATIGMEWFTARAREHVYDLLRRPAVLTVLVILTVLLAPGKSNGFIYFAF